MTPHYFNSVPRAYLAFSSTAANMDESNQDHAGGEDYCDAFFQGVGPMHEAHLDMQDEVIMRSGDLLGLVVTDPLNGSTLGRVRDLLFCHVTNRIVALVLAGEDTFELANAQIVPWEEIHTLGKDSILLKNHASKMAWKDFRSTLTAAGECEVLLLSTRISTPDGRRLGTLADLCFDEFSGQITGFEIFGGFVADTLHNKKFTSAI